MRLDDVYNLLQRSSEMDITVQETPLLANHTFSAEKMLTLLGSGAFSIRMEGDTSIQVPTVRRGQHASFVPQGAALIEVDGNLVLGMKCEEVTAMLKYACAKSKTGNITISVMQPDYARAFLAALLVTVDVYGNSEWRPTDVLRKSLEFQSKRRESGRRKLRPTTSTGTVASVSTAYSASAAAYCRCHVGALNPSGYCGTPASGSTGAPSGSGSKLRRALSSLLSARSNAVAAPSPLGQHGRRLGISTN